MVQARKRSQAASLPRLNTTAEAILGLLALGAMSGYEIRRLVQFSIGHFWSESFGQIYPALQRLAAAGLIERQKSAGKRTTARQSHTYCITEKGRKHLAAWVPVEYRNQVPRNELLLKLFFGRNAPARVSAAHIERFRGEQESRLRVYDATERTLRAEHAGDPNLPFWLITLSFGRHEAEAMLRWCDESLAEIAPLAGGPGERAPAHRAGHPGSHGTEHEHRHPGQKEHTGAMHGP